MPFLVHLCTPHDIISTKMMHLVVGHTLSYILSKFEVNGTDGPPVCWSDHYLTTGDMASEPMPQQLITQSAQATADAWFIMKCWKGWLQVYNLKHNSLLNAKLIYMFALWDPDNMCYEMREPIFIYTAKMLDSSTGLLVGALFKSRWSDSIIWHPPFWEYITWQFTTRLLGMCAAAHCNQGPWTVWVNSS